LLGQQIGTEKTIWLHDAAQLGKWPTSGLARVGLARLVEVVLFCCDPQSSTWIMMLMQELQRRL
jgi:hypothetical protein